MEEERYLEIFITPSELGPNLKENLLLKLKEKILHKEIPGRMITNIKSNDLNNIPLSRTTTNNIEYNVTTSVTYEIYKPGNIIIGDIYIKDLFLYQTIYFVKLLIQMILKITN